MTDAALQLLRNTISNFVQLTDVDWQLLLPHLHEKKLAKGALFAQEGKTATEVGFVISGNMRHYYTRDGEEKTTYFYFEGHFVSAYFSCISRTPSDLTIEAMTDCSLVVFKYAVLRSLFEQSHTWERFGRLMAEYLALGLEKRMADLLLLSPEERYIELIRSNKQKILERIPQAYIANYLGITPVSLSRIRNRVMHK